MNAFIPFWMLAALLAFAFRTGLLWLLCGLHWVQ